MAHRSKRKPFFIGVRIFPADRGSHVVDRTAIVFIQEPTRLLAELAVPVLVRCQIGFHESIRRHAEMLGDPFGIGSADLDTEGFAAVGTAGAIDNLENTLVQFSSQFVGIEAVIPELQAAEKLVVLVVVRLGIPPPVFHHDVVIHAVFLTSACLLRRWDLDPSGKASQLPGGTARDPRRSRPQCRVAAVGVPIHSSVRSLADESPEVCAFHL